MSNHALNWAFNTDAEHGARLVLLALANCHNGQTKKCCPSITHLEKTTRLGRTAIFDGIQQLEALGLITVNRRNGVHSKYELSIPDQSENRTSLETEPVQKADGTSTDSVRDQYGFRTRNRKEPETTVAAAPHARQQRAGRRERDPFR